MIVDGYVRVSQTRGRGGASFISPQVQRDEVVGWIGPQGLVLGEVFEELDESGAHWHCSADRGGGSCSRGRTSDPTNSATDRYWRALADAARASDGPDLGRAMIRAGRTMAFVRQAGKLLRVRAELPPQQV